MGTGVLGENLVQLLAGLVAVGGAGLLRHLDAAVGHEGALQGLIGLQADDLFQILQLGVDIAGAVGGQTGDDFGLHVQNAALGALLFLQFLQSAPQLVGSVGRAGEEALIAVIRGVVLLDEVTGVDFLFPDAAFKAFPLFEICHYAPLLSYGQPGFPTRQRYYTKKSGFAYVVSATLQKFYKASCAKNARSFLQMRRGGALLLPYRTLFVEPEDFSLLFTF